ncbi:MAG: ATP-binding cassette domain-containing protein [bacterium]|nr:ATP-binding cassette domain-containing protein [bacterium]
MATNFVDDRKDNGVIFRAEGISLAFGDKRILRDLTCEVRDVVRPGHVTGQVIGLLGPSGVGKTQLLRIIAGLNRPDSGAVFIGHELLPAQRGMVGVVFQHYPLFERRRVLSNLVVAGRRAGNTRAEATQRAYHYLERFHMADRAMFYPAQLSGGQRQRVAIAQQLMCSEHFIVMDEPFSGLDPIQVQTVVDLIFEVAGMHELNTVIVVSHDVDATVLAADTIWFMGRDRDEHGAIIPGARIQEVIDLVPLGLAWWQSPTWDSPGLDECARTLRKRFSNL